MNSTPVNETKEEKIKRLIQREIDLCLQEIKKLNYPKLEYFDSQIAHEHALESYYYQTGVTNARILALVDVLKEIETL